MGRTSLSVVGSHKENTGEHRKEMKSRLKEEQLKQREIEIKKIKNTDGRKFVKVKIKYTVLKDGITIKEEK